MDYKQLLAKYMRTGADDIESGRCEMTEELHQALLKLIAKLPISKAQAIKFLGTSRSRFDYLLRINQIPQGKKRVGFKELVWYKDELEEYKPLFEKKTK